MYPTLVNPSQNQEHMNRGAGIYAVPLYPSMGPIAGVPPNNLIPLTYNIPTYVSSSFVKAFFLCFIFFDLLAFSFMYDILFISSCLL